MDTKLDKQYIINSVGQDIARLFDTNDQVKSNTRNYWDCMFQLIQTDLSKPIWLYVDGTYHHIKIYNSKQTDLKDYYFKIDVDHAMKTGNGTTFVQCKEYWDFVDKISQYKSDGLSLQEALTKDLENMIKNEYPKEDDPKQFDFEDVSYFECYLNQFLETWYDFTIDPMKISEGYQLAGELLKQFKGLNPRFDKRYFSENE